MTSDTTSEGRMLLTELPANMQDKIQVDGDSECWLWTGSKTHEGYGQVGLDSKTTLVHRAAYSIAHPDKDIEGLHVHHWCGVRPCLNPAHLGAMTGSEHLLVNVVRAPVVPEDERDPSKDYCKYGHERSTENTYVMPRGWRRCKECSLRHRRDYAIRRGPKEFSNAGQDNGSSKLTDDDVRAIRAAHSEGATQASLAGRYGVHERNIWRVVHRKSWRHVA